MSDIEEDEVCLHTSLKLKRSFDYQNIVPALFINVFMKFLFY